MEANFFRYLILELGPALQGQRIEKVYQPMFGVWNFKLGTRKYLVFIPFHKRAALFLSYSKPENPERPSSYVQWFRKRLKGRRILDFKSNWQDRQVAFELSPGEGKWLFMDLHDGLQLFDSLPVNFYQDVFWPSLKEIISDKIIYKKYPHCTPPLRKTLSSISFEEAKALLEFLQFSKPQTFYLYTSSTKSQSLLIWRLPDILRQTQDQEEVFNFASEAAKEYGWRLLLSLYQEQSAEDKKRKKAIEKVQKNLERLEKDKQRLSNMAALQEQAMLIQANLYQIDAQQKQRQIEVLDFEGNKRTLVLNLDLNILQNMEYWFKRARKGRRGLKVVENRICKLKKELAQLKSNEKSVKTEFYSNKTKKDYQINSNSFPRYKGVDVHLYESSDGFKIIKGKNQKSNHRMLSQVAKPFDFWFHVKDGPGAHVVLRRDYEDQRVPNKSMREAAIIAGLASYQSQEKKGQIVCTLVKKVRKVKGSDYGQVNIDQIMDTLIVPLDKDIEQWLRIN